MPAASCLSNPLAGNPLKTRDDFVRAIKDLYLPLTPYYSKGCARVRLDMSAATFDRAAADLEGFARPLWGLAPLAAGGEGDFVDWGVFRTGLANGTDPEHPEFWGYPEACDQRLVEMSAIGFSLALIPQILWEPQPATAKANIAAYLQHAFKQPFVENNWMFFRIMVALGLEAIGEEIDSSLVNDYFTKLDALYLSDGWYSDGPFKRVDYYIPMAMQYFGLIYSRLGKDSNRKQIFSERAKHFTPQFMSWFADNGGALAFGRSLTYRFACAAFWSALAFAENPVLPWGQLKGLLLRHLRWWKDAAITHRDGVLSVGYGYPNAYLGEPYNSAGSPYWAFKSFICAALPADHPFWLAPEEQMPSITEPVTQYAPGMILFHPDHDVIALTSGQEESQKWLRHAAEKYSKFAYSARYGFSVENDFRQFDGACFDNMLALSRDNRHFMVRESHQEVKIADNLIYSRWSPEEEISVETWLYAANPWHVRIHRINSKRRYFTIEGGFALARADRTQCREQGEEVVSDKPPSAYVVTAEDFSGIRDLSVIPRQARILEALPNTNLMSAKTSVPQLCGEIPAGESVLVTAVLAVNSAAAGKSAWKSVLQVPSVDELMARIRREGKCVAYLQEKD